MSTEKPALSRDGTVTLAGEVIGHVHGEPRNWCFTLADNRYSRRTPGTGWHSKREAAEMCASAWRETRLPAPNASERHNLRGLGMPFLSRDGGGYVLSRLSSSRGRAVCTCGEASETLQSNEARQAWHADHIASASPDKPEEG